MRSGSIFGAAEKNASVFGSTTKLRTADTSKKAKYENEEKKDSTKLVSSRRGLMEESVRNLKEQIKKLSENESLSADEKKDKIKDLNEKVKELEKQFEEGEREVSLLSSNQTKKDTTLERKAKARKDKLEQKTKGIPEVNVGISEEGFKSLIQAEMALDNSQKMNELKSETAQSLTRAKIERDNDKEYGQVMADAAWGADARELARKAEREATSEFKDKTTLNEYVWRSVTDPSDKKRFEEIIKGYYDDRKSFAAERVKKVIDEFPRYQYVNEKKEAHIAELEDIMGNLEDAYTHFLSNAMQETKNMSEAEQEETQGSSSEKETLEILSEMEQSHDHKFLANENELDME